MQATVIGKSSGSVHELAKMDWTKVLQCPQCNTRGLTVHTESNSGLLPERGAAICNHCNAQFPIRDHVLDLVQRGDVRYLTLAGWSNFLPFLPWGYEHLWRPRSLTLLSGEAFPMAREIALLNDWLNVQPGELIVDLGSSTDGYARGIGKHHTNATVIAIDMAIGMLRAGRQYAVREGVNNIVHLRAPVQRLPFANATVDALMCGGSLNEFRAMDEAFREARRVIKPEGRMFVMSLLAATRLPGRLAQAITRPSGIQFPTLAEFNRLMDVSGWHCERQQIVGLVAFTLLKLKR